MQSDHDQTPEAERSNARRAFLKKCGRFAAITGPAVALMVVSSTKAKAGCIVTSTNNCN